MPNNPISDAALAELDRLQHGTTPRPWLYGKVWLDHVPNYMAVIALHNAYPALRQRLLDAESRLAEVERERDQLRALADAARDGMRQLGEDLVASRAEVERLRKYNESLLRERDELIASLAGLRGALDIARVKFDWIRQNAEPPAIDGGIGSVWRAAISAHTEVVAALALTPASAGDRLKAEALREMAREIYRETDSQIARSIIELINERADLLTAEQKEAANGR